MSRKEQIPSLDTIAGGAVAEAFELEFEKVMRNIVDPNTDSQAKREITVRIVFKPVGNDREEVLVGSQVTSKLAPNRPTLTTMFVENSRGVVAATEYVRDRESQYVQ
jgi:hypothetical protein